MGEVYRARDTRLDRTVAIKVLAATLAGTPDVRERFAREARAISALNHPHICTLYDVGHEQGVDYLVMEYLDGEPLNRRIGGRPLPVAVLLDLAIDITDALDVAHAGGILHRDLKPANLFVTARGQVKILDFGVARIEVGRVDAAAGATAMSASTTELLPLPVTARARRSAPSPTCRPSRRAARVARAAILFSFGAVFYEMATGHRAFRGDDDRRHLRPDPHRAPVL